MPSESHVAFWRGRSRATSRGPPTSVGARGRVGGDVGVYEGHLGDAERDNPSWDVRLLEWRTRAAGFRGKIIRYFLRAATYGAARRCCHLAASSPSIQFYEYNRARPAATRRAPRRSVPGHEASPRATRTPRRAAGRHLDASALASVDASHARAARASDANANATRLESRVVSRRFSATSATSRGAHASSASSTGATRVAMAATRPSRARRPSACVATEPSARSDATEQSEKRSSSSSARRKPRRVSPSKTRGSFVAVSRFTNSSPSRLFSSSLPNADRNAFANARSPDS